MSKIYVTLTDRSPHEELDLRKNKLNATKDINFFKVDENGEVIGRRNTSLYFGSNSIIREFELVLEDNFKSNIKDSGFFSSYISKEKFNKFIKFTKKYGKLSEISLDSKQGVLDQIELLTKELKELYNEKEGLENTFKSLELKGKNGRWRKINYKNIIIFSSKDNGYESNIQISDKHTNITHSIDDANFYNFRLKESSYTYYGFYSFGNPTQVLKAGIKGTKKYLDVCERISVKGKEIREYVINNLLDLFN